MAVQSEMRVQEIMNRMQGPLKWRVAAVTGLAAIAVLLGGCGLLGRGAEPTPTPVRVLVPTFTPTPADAAAVEPDAVAQAPVAEEPVSEQAPTETPAPPEEPPTPEPPPEEPPTPTPAPKLVINIQSANVRNGPGTSYGLVGAVNGGQAFDITGRNPEGDWWQFCCVNGQEGWIFSDLVGTENAQDVPVAENIPAPPAVAVQPPPQPDAPPEPTAVPPPAESDPCAGIGGDGCKFKVRNGPKFAPNGGTEIKLQLLFVHSGIDGGQPQGSYFVVLMKDGVKLPISDGVRSISLDKSDGALGAFNYEFKIGIGDIPGNTVAGNYVMFVLDGNGERDSRDLNFSIPDGQGEVWIEWDQG